MGKTQVSQGLFDFLGASDFWTCRFKKASDFLTYPGKYADPPQKPKANSQMGKIRGQKGVKRKKIPIVGKNRTRAGRFLGASI